jgi:hypothetical protein
VANDYDGDGRLDLAVAGWSGNASVSPGRRVTRKLSCGPIAFYGAPVEFTKRADIGWFTRSRTAVLVMSS